MKKRKIKLAAKEEGETRSFPEPGRTAREDTSSVMEFYGLPEAFPKAVLDEAARAAAEPVSAAGRLDLRKKMIFTCDPVTARDYDDALSIEKDRRDNRTLGVHIADVSHYVKSGTRLDKEAAKRSTSVYFPGRVVPMLPESLCDGVCSLVPGQDRLAFSVFMVFDKSGKLIKTSFAKSIINSKMRFTYEQVMGIISGSVKSGKWTKPIREIHGLAMQLRSARFSAGALDLDIPEQEVLLDAQGEMSGIVTRPYDESHQMIEECMVAANEAVARELWTKGIRILARLHEAPDREKIEELREQAELLGVKCGNIANPAAFTRFLGVIKSHPLYPVLAVMVLRSMKRAVYDSGNIGHFGLAKRFYAHFTSPIRRYPDLTLHRQLTAYLEGEKAKIPSPVLAKWAAHATEAEQNAAEAERSLLEIKKYRLLEDEIRSRAPVDYDAVVSKCTPFGCFVEISDISVSGLVHISFLSRKFVRFDRARNCLVAPGGKTWKTGDRMKVRVLRVDYAQRRIDFVPSGNGRQP